MTRRPSAIRSVPRKAESGSFVASFSFALVQTGAAAPVARCGGIVSTPASQILAGGVNV